MKQLNILFLVIAWIVLTNASLAAADTVKQEKLGKVVAVERTFKVELNECEKTYRFSHLGKDHSQCGVVVMPSNVAETLVSAFPAVEITTTLQGKALTAGLGGGKNAYYITVYTNEGADLSFPAVREALEALVNKLPNREIKLIVYTVEKE